MGPFSTTASTSIQIWRGVVIVFLAHLTCSHLEVNAASIPVSVDTRPLGTGPTGENVVEALTREIFVQAEAAGGWAETPENVKIADQLAKKSAAEADLNKDGQLDNIEAVLYLAIQKAGLGNLKTKAEDEQTLSKVKNLSKWDKEKAKVKITKVIQEPVFEWFAEKLYEHR